MKLRWLLRGLIVVTTILLVIVIYLRHQMEQRALLPVIGDVPAFSLIEADGRTVTLDDLKGRPWVAAFIFTRCGTICPIMSAQMTKLPARTLQLVSFSVDPEFDTPAVLTKYAARYRQSGDRWFFLTGQRDAVRSLARDGFHLAAEDAAEDDHEPILHSSHLVLVDGEGRIRGYYDGTDADHMARLVKDARLLRP